MSTNSHICYILKKKRLYLDIKQQHKVLNEVIDVCLMNLCPFAWSIWWIVCYQKLRIKFYPITEQKQSNFYFLLCIFQPFCQHLSVLFPSGRQQMATFDLIILSIISFSLFFFSLSLCVSVPSPNSVISLKLSYCSCARITRVNSTPK